MLNRHMYMPSQRLKNIKDTKLSNTEGLVFLQNAEQDARRFPGPQAVQARGVRTGLVSCLVWHKGGERLRQARVSLLITFGPNK